MKKSSLLLFFIFLTFGVKSQSLIGAWERHHLSENGETLKSVVIFSDGFQAETTYDLKSGEFISTNGGSWTLSGDTITEKVEFDSKNPERVGTEVNFEVSINDSILTIVKDGIIFNKIDNAVPANLDGAWLMYGSVKENGETQFRDTNQPRKTMKILSGTRFQWIAYNTETKQFVATGGGTYTTTDKDYIETIEFFSKDNSKVGNSLKFNYNVVDNNWHHSGFSSVGNPIHEIWSLRK